MASKYTHMDNCYRSHPGQLYCMWTAITCSTARSKGLEVTSETFYWAF